MSELEQIKLLENAAANPLERRAAATALAGSSDPRAREALRRATKDPQWLIRAEAVRALREVPAILAALNDPVFALREQSLSNLAEIDDPEELTPLLEHTVEKDARVRRLVAVALGRLGNRDAVTVLEKRSKLPVFGGDPDPEVRKAAQQAIQQIRERAAVGEGMPSVSGPERWKGDRLPRPSGSR